MRLALCPMFFALFLSCSACAQPGTLTINVSVTGPGGEPVPDFEIAAQYADDGSDEVADVTLVDQNGSAVLSLPTPAVALTLLIAVSQGDDPAASADERFRRKERYWKAIRPEYHFEPYYEFTVMPGQQNLDAQLQFTEGVTVSGRLVDDAGQPVPFPFVMARGVPMYAASRQDGSFELTSVAQGEPCELFVIGDETTTALAVAAQQTQQDVHLGDVSQEPRTMDATGSISIDDQGWTGRQRDFQDVLSGVTLIASDGSFLLAFTDNADGDAVAAPMSQDTTLPIPSGTYYLVAGTFSPIRDIHYKALKLVQSGQAAQVEGWPTLTVEAGQHVSVSFNAAATDALIEAAPEP